MWSFYKALFKNPRAIGAVIPSSTHLAEAIAKFVPVSKDKIIVELGAGTGVITQAILDHGIPPENLIAVESSEVLVRQLRERFPRVQVVHGDAAELGNLLKQQRLPVGTVICGLPLLLLPEETVQAILGQVDQVLIPGGRYIKYTYGSKDSWSRLLTNYTKITAKRVWLNIPPARVCVYESPL